MMIYLNIFPQYQRNKSVKNQFVAKTPEKKIHRFLIVKMSFEHEPYYEQQFMI